MNYAYPSDRPFTTKKAVAKKAALSQQAKNRRSYIRSHQFSVVVDPSTKQAHVEVTKKSNE